MPTRAAKRALARRGTKVDIINRTKNDGKSDKYGDVYDDDEYSGNPVTARIVRGGGATKDHAEYGTRVEGDAEIFIPDDISEVIGGGGQRATRLDVESGGEPEYLVLEVDKQENGLIRLVCERIANPLIDLSESTSDRSTTGDSATVSINDASATDRSTTGESTATATDSSGGWTWDQSDWSFDEWAEG